MSTDITIEPGLLPYYAMEFDPEAGFIWYHLHGFETLDDREQWVNTCPPDLIREPMDWERTRQMFSLDVTETIRREVYPGSEICDDCDHQHCTAVKTKANEATRREQLGESLKLFQEHSITLGHDGAGNFDAIIPIPEGRDFDTFSKEAWDTLSHAINFDTRRDGHCLNGQLVLPVTRSYAILMGVS